MILVMWSSYSDNLGLKENVKIYTEGFIKCWNLTKILVFCFHFFQTDEKCTKCDQIKKIYMFMYKIAWKTSSLQILGLICCILCWMKISSLVVPSHHYMINSAGQLRQKVPETIIHIFCECDFVKPLWLEIYNIFYLNTEFDCQLSNFEKVFGIFDNKFLTYYFMYQVLYL